MKQLDLLAHACPDDAFQIVRKRVKYLRVSVHAPMGEVRVSAPLRMSTRSIREFIDSKLEWIRRQQQRIRSRTPAPRQVYLDDETHLVWGVEHRLQLVAHNAAPCVEVNGELIRLHVRPDSSIVERKQVLFAWYRAILAAAIPSIIARWEPVLQVSVARFFVRDMKTRWGSCTPRSRRIRLSTELAMKSLACVEYVVVHEMVHLLEASHNRRFVRLMDRFLPEWRLRRKELNRRPT